MKKLLALVLAPGFRSALAACLALVCLAPLGFTQPGLHRRDGHHQIDQLEEDWRQAVLKSDTNAMSALLADDFMGITARGTLQTRDQVLDNMRTGRIHLTALDVSDRKVRIYGKTAVVTSFAHMEGTNIDGDMTGNFRYTRVYVKNQAGEWKIVSFEASRVHVHGEHY
jgi:ketosteroid isomerase-like protein